MLDNRIAERLNQIQTKVTDIQDTLDASVEYYIDVQDEVDEKLNAISLLVDELKRMELEKPFVPEDSSN